MLSIIASAFQGKKKGLPFENNGGPSLCLRCFYLKFALTTQELFHTPSWRFHTDVFLYRESFLRSVCATRTAAVKERFFSAAL